MNKEKDYLDFNQITILANFIRGAVDRPEEVIPRCTQACRYLIGDAVKAAKIIETAILARKSPSSEKDRIQALRNAGYATDGLVRKLILSICDLMD